MCRPRSHSLPPLLLSTHQLSMSSPAPPVKPAVTASHAPTGKKQPYPFYLGGLAATIAASITHPLDLTKVRLQASGDKRMIESMRKTVRTAGVRGLYDGITGTWLRQMSYSLCRFWAYDESKKYLGAGPDSPPWMLAAAGVMGMSHVHCRFMPLNPIFPAGSIAGIVGNPGEVVMVCDTPHAPLPITQCIKSTGPPSGRLRKAPGKAFQL